VERHAANGCHKPSIFSAALMGAGVDGKASRHSGIAKWSVTPPMGCREPSILSAALMGAGVIKVSEENDVAKWTDIEMFCVSSLFYFHGLSHALSFPPSFQQL